MKKKVIAFIVFLILILSSLGYMIVKNNSNVKESVVNKPNPTPNSSASKTTPGQFKDCLVKQANSLKGEWTVKVSENNYIPYIDFNSDNKFVIGDKSSGTIFADGVWIYNQNEGAITFKINKLHSSWVELLSDSTLKDKYPEIVNYSINEKFIKFNISYSDPSRIFDGNCDESRFAINLFGFFLYPEK